MSSKPPPSSINDGPIGLGLTERSNDGPHKGGSGVQKTISVKLWSVQLSKWELGFIKNDMAT